MGQNAKKNSDIKVLREQLRLMAAKIMEEGARMPEEPLIMPYDNGGGQSGTRENPYYPAYKRLLDGYTKTLQAAKALSDGNDAEIMSLESLRSKFKVAK